MPYRLVAVPDTDGELEHLLRRLEEVLLHLQPAEEDQAPAPPGLGPSTVDGLARVLEVLLPALGAPAAQPVALDGGSSLAPLRFVSLDADALAAVGEGIAALGRARLPGGDEVVRHVLREACTDHGEHSSLLVAGFARAHGLLDLAPDDDTWELAALLGRRTGPVVLSAGQETAYRRLTARLRAMFRAGAARRRKRA